MWHVGDWVYCECGEHTMQYGRCIGCKKVRPSSEDQMVAIRDLKKQLSILEGELEETIKLENDDI
jgi:hypothetical protein